ncbi:MAG: hypothetical protein L0H93_09765 [Nocardioides sp.]|nr:hypothetical protein [Nocardioides sp.]
MPYQHPTHAQQTRQTRQEGQTGLHNSGRLGWFDRVKTHSGYGVREPRPGTYVWRTPHDRYLVVDHTGTRRLGEPTGHALFTTEGRAEQWHILRWAEIGTISHNERTIELTGDYTPSHAA